MERYELKMGECGAYFYDTKEDNDLTLDQALNLLNGKRINTQTKQEVAEKNRVTQWRHKSERNNPEPKNYTFAANVFNKYINHK